MKMKKLCRFAFILLISVALSGAQRPPAEPGTPRRPVRFRALDVIIDSGDAELAAYQVEVRGTHVQLQSVENGEHPAFDEPPYYDREALQHDRIILAALHTGADLPKGRTRVARLHLYVVGDETLDCTATLTVAADRDGERIAATVTLSQGEGE